MGCSCLLPALAIPYKFPSFLLNGPNPPSPTFMAFSESPRRASAHFLPMSPFHGNVKFHRRGRGSSILHLPVGSRKLAIRASIQESAKASSKTKLIFVCSVITVALAVANRVLYKLALVPLKQYPFFLAQLTTFGYVAIYFSILYVRYRMGIVTDEMMAIPKSPFLIIGILEALGVTSGMASGAMLPGPAIPILNQTFLVWQLAFSALLLGRKYSWNKIAGCLLVIAGIVVAVGG